VTKHRSRLLACLPYHRHNLLIAGFSLVDRCGLPPSSIVRSPNTIAVAAGQQQGFTGRVDSDKVCINQDFQHKLAWHILDLRVTSLCNSII
jgi:hypothetical protein